MFNNKIKGYLSLISSVLIHLLIGNLFSFANLIPYYQSFLYYKHNNTEVISLMQLYFIAPIGIFVHNTFPSFMGIVDKKVGIRVLTFFATASLYFSQLIIYFSIEYYLLLISYALYGLAASATYFQTLRNCWKYFPHKKDLISGIVFSSFGLSSFIFTSIADHIINPDNISKEGKYYSKEISFRFLKYIKVFIFCIVILGSISSILCFPFEEENKINLNSEQDKEVIDTENNIDEKKEILLTQSQHISLIKKNYTFIRICKMLINCRMYSYVWIFIN